MSHSHWVQNSIEALLTVERPIESRSIERGFDLRRILDNVS